MVLVPTPCPDGPGDLVASWLNGALPHLTVDGLLDHGQTHDPAPHTVEVGPVVATRAADQMAGR